MINISVVQIDGLNCIIDISGHANADIIGKDIICASVSTASQMMLYGILCELELNVDYTQDPTGHLHINLTNEKAKTSKILTDTFVGFAKQLQRQYPNYINMEVLE